MESDILIIVKILNANLYILKGVLKMKKDVIIKRIINGQEIIVKLTKQEEESIYEKIA